MPTIDLFDNLKLSLKHALTEVYIITPGEIVGDGEIESPGGKRYTISGFTCDCPNKQASGGGSHLGHCKHEIWLSQIYPCGQCDRHMLLSKVVMAGSDESLYEYRCGNKHIETWEYVKGARS